MIRPIDIRLNAAHPDLPLAEAVTYTGAPSTVLIRGVPGNCGRWAITAVFVAVAFPDGSTTTRTAVQSANGVWVATIPATATSGRTAHGLRILADGADENGEAVSGYVLGVADFAVASLDVTPAPQPGGIAYALRYFDTLPDPAKKGDVIRVNGDLKLYNGTAWQPFTDLSNYYTAEQVDEAIDKLAAYYITYNAAGAAFPTRAALLDALAYYSGGELRVPTRNDYAVVLADEAHGGAEWRYIYAVADGQMTGQWEAQYPIETNDYDALANKPSINNVTLTGNKSADDLGLASKSDVDPLLFAQYYPEGNVKSAAEFTANIKYDAPDTTNRTIMVKPFCNTETAANDNSGLVGRVVIPPFVDAQGNPYISDDGTRFKVVGVSGGVADISNNNLTAIIAPSTVTTIGGLAFSDCDVLTTVSLPAATTISGSAFASCDALTTVSLPAVTNIGYNAFALCNALTTVSLPAATDIGGIAFAGCTSLVLVDFGDTPRSSVPTLGNDAFDGVPTSCKIIVPYTQYDAWTAASGWSSLSQEFVRHSEKADKPATFTTGNLAKFDENGNPVDSDKKPSDFQSSLTVQQLANIDAVPNKLGNSGAQRITNGSLTVVGGNISLDGTHKIMLDEGFGIGLVLNGNRVVGISFGDGAAKNVVLTLDGEDTIAFLSNIGILAFDSTATYAVGAKVVYSNAVWNCTTAVSTAGAWTGTTNWTKLFDLAVDSTPTANSNSLMTSGAIKTALDAKANRASNPTAGNLAALDANGNPTDAGYHFEVRNGIPCIVQYT